MEREGYFDRESWADRFVNDGAYFASPECGVSCENVLELDAEILEKVRSCFLVRTSGSSGRAKWVVHSKRNLLDHAELVNRHLGVTSDDVFGLVLPVFHVGGVGVIARALVSGAGCVSLGRKWSASNCVRFLVENKVSVVSLVPTQVVDIVDGGYECPDSVRVVVVGGGKLDSGVFDKASELGWVICESYGMTETGSQIATGVMCDSYLRLIEGWEVRVGEDGLLAVKGRCLLKGYLIENEGGFSLVDPKEDGWFRTSDRMQVLVEDGVVGVRFIGRSDQQVKILGELVDVSDLERRLSDELSSEVYLVPLADERRGVRLFPVVTDVSLIQDISDLAWSGVERLEGAVSVPEFPRNVMGKLCRSMLVDAVESVVFSSD